MIILFIGIAAIVVVVLFFAIVLGAFGFITGSGVSSM